MTTQSRALVLPHRKAHMMSIVLNRPRAINSLNIEMIRTIRSVLDEVRNSQRYRYVLFYGTGDRGFCAGGDIKALAQSVQKESSLGADLILKEEYDLLLSIHHFPKPVIVLADGITMGAGLGLAAADLVVAVRVEPKVVLKCLIISGNYIAGFRFARQLYLRSIFSSHTN